MTVNYLAVRVAAAVGWLAGAVWYTVLAKPWVAAHSKTMEEFKAEQAAHKGTLHAWLPFVLAFVAELVMAWCCTASRPTSSRCRCAAP
jgi:hypothetical protein